MKNFKHRTTLEEFHSENLQSWHLDPTINILLHLLYFTLMIALSSHQSTFFCGCISEHITDITTLALNACVCSQSSIFVYRFFSLRGKICLTMKQISRVQLLGLGRCIYLGIYQDTQPHRLPESSLMSLLGHTPSLPPPRQTVFLCYSSLNQFGLFRYLRNGIMRYVLFCVSSVTQYKIFVVYFYCVHQQFIPFYCQVESCWVNILQFADPVSFCKHIGFPYPPVFS